MWRDIAQTVKTASQSIQPRMTAALCRNLTTSTVSSDPRNNRAYLIIDAVRQIGGSNCSRSAIDGFDEYGLRGATAVASAAQGDRGSVTLINRRT